MLFKNPGPSDAHHSGFPLRRKVSLHKKGYKCRIEASTYYAIDCALVDTVLISPNPIKISELPAPLNEVVALIDEYCECADADLGEAKRLNGIKNEILLELRDR